MSKKILLVEDEALIAMAEARMLQKHGYEVITTHKGEKAVSIVEEEPDIYLILMDIDLGKGIDGTEAAQKILQNHDIPIVFLSSHTEPEVVEKTEGITSYGYIVKNSGNTVLLASIKMAFRLFEAKKDVRDREEALKGEKEKLQHYIGIIEERRRIDKERNRHLLELFEKMELSQKILFDYVLQASLTVTNSEYGFSGFINQDETIMSIHKWSMSAMADCAALDKPIDFPIEEAGIWGDCIRERKPVIINDYKNDTRASKHGTPKGHVKITRFLCIPVFDGDNIVAVGAVANKEAPYDFADADAITILYDKMWSIIRQQKANKALEESEARLHAILNNSPWLISEVDLDGRYLLVNPALAAIFGLQPSQMIGKSFKELLPEETAKLFKDRIDQVRSSGEVIHIEDDIQTDSGFRHYQTALFPFRYKGRDSHSIGSIAHDITERKRAEEEIKKQLSEKEILLREVHHRVKNNIANIESLLSLQAGETEKPEVKTALQDAISRVRSMRVLYDKLLVSKDLREISMKKYIEDLIDSLQNVFIGRDTIIIEKHISEFSITSKQAITIGILINELMNNVFKYAFKDCDRGTVSISIEKSENTVTIIIQDNGIGIDEKILENKSPGFGLSLVKMLVEYLEGTYSIVNENGTKSTIQFEV